MATIITRAGKGTPLTHNEVDSNFTNLNQPATASSEGLVSTGEQDFGGFKTFSVGKIRLNSTLGSGIWSKNVVLSNNNTYTHSSAVNGGLLIIKRDGGFTAVYILDDTTFGTTEVSDPSGSYVKGDPGSGAGTTGIESSGSPFKIHNRTGGSASYYITIIANFGGIA